MFKYFALFLLSLQFPCLCHCEEQELLKENRKIMDTFDKIKKFYNLKPNENWREITSEILSSAQTAQICKNWIREYKRRFFVFKYPSDHLWVKGFISFTPNSFQKPLLVLYRWGNENFALMNPATLYSTHRDYMVVSSALRGGVSEGSDEFGGADVNDMKNLLTYLPELAKELGIKIEPSGRYMLGPSRGGMEMFLTLRRFPELQNNINKIVSLSGILDMRQLIHDRSFDMKVLFERQFGYLEGCKGKDWISKRDPLNTIPYLRRSLPILIIQGTADPRINLIEGRRMAEKLKKSGHKVTYWEIKNGNHVLTNDPQIMNDIAHWLESK